MSPEILGEASVGELAPEILVETSVGELAGPRTSGTDAVFLDFSGLAQKGRKCRRPRIHLYEAMPYTSYTS